MNLWVLKDRECMDLVFFREKGEIELTTPGLNFFFFKKRKLIKHHLKAFLSPAPHPEQTRIKTTEAPSVAFTGGRRKSWYRLMYMCTDTVGRKSKVEILWYALTYYHI